MAHLFAQQQEGEPTTSPLHSMIEDHQRKSQNNITRDASREIQRLGQLPAKVLGFEHVDAVVESAMSGALSWNNAPRVITVAVIPPLLTPTKKKTGNDEKIVELRLANI
ncbi:hypothetical protein IWZ03DRAFT_425992 [Phyllosticta citriasiana]|uniref:Uncharacterized protein n=1 Tax=Phyllosticta citriasiana TaxID=595635 RepID=A0ABR1KC89_9PEZI